MQYSKNVDGKKGVFIEKFYKVCYNKNIYHCKNWYHIFNIKNYYNKNDCSKRMDIK